MSPGRGLTVSALLAIPAVVVGALVCWRRRHRSVPAASVAADVGAWALERDRLTAESLDAVVYGLSTAALQLMGPTATAQTAELQGTLGRVRTSLDRSLAEVRFLARLQRPAAVTPSRRDPSGPVRVPGADAAGSSPDSIVEHADRCARQWRRAGLHVSTDISAPNDALLWSTRITVVRTLDAVGTLLLGQASTGSTVRVVIAQRGTEVVIRVRVETALSLSPGLGGADLEALRRRVELCGGRYHAGPEPDAGSRAADEPGLRARDHGAGWSVLVVLPL